jgi:hypothetical protein
MLLSFPDARERPRKENSDHLERSSQENSILEVVEDDYSGFKSLSAMQAVA